MSLLLLRYAETICRTYSSHASAGIALYIVHSMSKIRHLDISNNSVIYCYSLSSVFTCSFCFKHINMVNQFLRKQTSQHLNIKKSANSIYKRLLTDFDQVVFGAIFKQFFIQS